MGIASLHPSYAPANKFADEHAPLASVYFSVNLARQANQFCFPEIVSSPGIENIPVFIRPKSLHINSHPVPIRGALAIVTNEGRVAVDASSAEDERRQSVRRSRVVLTPRGWRQAIEKLALLRRNGGKSAWLTEESTI